MVAVAGRVDDIRTEAEFEAVIKKEPVVVHFWAPWSEPCKHMDKVLEQLAEENRRTRFLRVEAEEVADISEKYDVAAVPYFLLFKNGEVVDEVEGADPVQLSEKVVKHLQGPSRAAAGVSSVEKAVAATAAARQREQVNERINALLRSAPVMLFMKGTPDEPRCGFSAKVVEVLRQLGVDFKHFDILADEAIREGLKAYSSWPTYPQLYLKGDLIGGADIVLELHTSGELKATMAEALAEDKATLHTRLEHLIRSAPIMLFMKGSLDEPKCKFSRQVVAAVRDAGAGISGFSAEFKSFDILQDESVRTGLKDFSNWPTFPQLYVEGKLVGGADIVSEMAVSGELRDLISETLTQRSGGNVKERIQQLLHQRPVMLFMKGNPEAPRCGFSKRVVEALQEVGEDFGSFDILSDEGVRQGLKEVSQWPTYPQLFVCGELLGGCDIVEEMRRTGDLKQTIEEMKQVGRTAM